MSFPCDSDVFSIIPDLVPGWAKVKIIEHRRYGRPPVNDVYIIGFIISKTVDSNIDGTLFACRTPLPISEGDTIYETSYAPNKLTYKAHSAKGGVALFSEVYFPWGWKATVNGKETPIGQADYVLRALRLPAGDSEIVMTFDPEPVKKANAVSIAAVILIYLLALGAVGRWIFKSIHKANA